MTVRTITLREFQNTRQDQIALFHINYHCFQRGAICANVSLTLGVINIYYDIYKHRYITNIQYRIWQQLSGIAYIKPSPLIMM
jgi:hypothetical protein